MTAFITLGAFPFHANAVELGAVPRTVTVSCNALSSEPVQTVAYISGFMPIRIDSWLQGLNTLGETAAEHLVRLRANLKTEVGKDHNTLSIVWRGLGTPETYRVFKNEDYALSFKPHAPATHRVDFTLTLNCLP